MTMLKARRAFPFQGSVLQRGAVIDPHDYPEITEKKWNQLKNPEAGHRFFEEIDPPGRSAREASMSRATAELDRARGAPDSSEPEASAPVQSATCPDCGFVAKNSHGLLVHSGRKH